MNPNFETAVFHFLANEFHLPVEQINSDTDFYQDLGLNRDKLSLLLESIQEALNIILPENALDKIITVGDIFLILNPEEPTNEPQ